MKLLLISRDFPNMFGGVSDYTCHLSRALAEKGENVYVLTSSNEKVSRNIEGGSVKVLPVIKKWGFLGMPQIIREIKNINPDWVLLQYVPYMYNYYGIPVWIAILAFLLRFKNHKLVTTFHEVAIRFDVKKPKYWGIAIIERLIAYTLCICSTKIVVSIEYFKKMLKPFKYKIVRIPVGSSVLPGEVPEVKKKTLHQKLAPNGDFIISSFGSGAYWRRNDILLKAVKECLNMGFDRLKVFIIGKASTDKNLLHIVNKLNLEKIVHFTGVLSPEEIYKYLAVSDLFIFLDTDAYGGINTKSTSLAAAYAAGLPIIGNKGILTDGFFKDKENIYLINSVDFREVAGSILELFKNQDLYNTLKRGSEESYKNILSWDRISERYTEILNEIC